GYYQKDLPNAYRLTYFATSQRSFNRAYEWTAPTNEWRRRAGKSFFEATKGALTVVAKGALTGGAEQPEMAETLAGEVVSESALTIIFSGPSSPVPPAPPDGVLSSSQGRATSPPHHPGKRSSR